MKSIGFVISGKENESRLAILPRHLKNIKNIKRLFFEKGYANGLGIPDASYEKIGANVVDRDEAYNQDIICNPKTPTLSEQSLFHQGQTLFGWIHAVQGRQITDFLINHYMTAIAWENMFESGRHSFWHNNEISGVAAIIHGIRFTGLLPEECKVALIGRGNVARGAFRTLAQLGANVVVYDRKTVQLLRKEIDEYDIIVNAVLWDVFRNDHIIYKEDLNKMKPGSMIIDISCDECMGIETSHSTTFNDPIYSIDGIIHYAVDHTPALFYKSSTDSISKVVYRFVDDLVEENSNPILEKATIIKNGVILDERISKFQKRK